MNIFIFRNKEALIEVFAKNKDRSSILDFSDNHEVKEAAGKCYADLHLFSEEEKIKIRDEYIEGISDLGYYNNYSLQWLCHPISEKNELAPDNLFERLQNFLIFSRILSFQSKEILLILTDSEILIRDINGYLDSKGISCQVEGGRQTHRGRLKCLASRIKKKLVLSKNILHAQLWHIRTRYLKKVLDSEKTYTVIRTWFDHRTLSLLGKNEDIYFGRLPRYLKEKGKNLLFFGDFAYGFDHIFKHLKKECQESKIVLTRSLISGYDFLQSYWFMKSVEANIKLKTGIEILGINVDIVLRNYFYHYLGHYQIQANYLTYLALKKFIKAIKIDTFYLPFENYAWEKLSWRAISWNLQDINIIAFQHAQVALNTTKFFLGEQESVEAFLPDKIITLGEITRDMLIQKGHFPTDKLITGCALRQDYSIGGETVKRYKRKRILVQLWSVSKSIRMINFLYASGLHTSSYQITLNPHPNNPLKVLIPHLNFKYNNQFQLAKGTLIENFETHDMVIYHGTTTSLDAIAHGLPIIEVKFNDFISVDPLYDFLDFKWIVNQPNGLLGAIEKIYSLSDEEYFSRQQKGLEFVRKYFYPINEENLKVFLYEKNR